MVLGIAGGLGNVVDVGRRWLDYVDGYLGWPMVAAAAGRVTAADAIVDVPVGYAAGKSG